MKTVACPVCGAPIAEVEIVRTGKLAAVDPTPVDHGRIMVTETPSGKLLGTVARHGGHAAAGRLSYSLHEFTCSTTALGRSRGNTQPSNQPQGDTQ